MSSDSAPPPIPSTIVQLTGPIFLGDIFNWGLFGALSVQCYIYYLAFPKDRSLPKWIVGIVYIIELIQTILSTRDGFLYFGYGWGNMNILNEVGIIWFSIPVMTGIVSCIVQLFFAWRIWVISRSMYIPIIISVFSVVQAAAGIWAGIHAKIIGIWSEVQKRNGPPTIVWLGGTAICDVLITITMFYCLSTSRNGFRATNAILVKFIRLTIETGLVTSTLAVLDLVMFLAVQDANYHLAPATMLSKLYSNSLMVLLNARIRILNGRDVGFTTTDETLSWVPSSSVFQQRTAVSQTQPATYHLPKMGRDRSVGLNVSVTTNTETTSDGKDLYEVDGVDHQKPMPV